jgi:hypothetical protein
MIEYLALDPLQDDHEFSLEEVKVARLLVGTQFL